MLPAKKPAWLPLTAAFVALGLVSAEGVAAKCSGEILVPGYGYEVGKPFIVTLVDGSVVPYGWPEGDPSNIHSMEITCWNPATDEFGGVGVAVVLILTKDFVESTRAPIEGHLRGLHARVLGDFYRMATTPRDNVVDAETADPLART